ncbi:MAG TPA: AAA family ATPase [Stellaceae bacterium]|nr:AAA family ATPase [Stellaceae bacterium]
MAIRFDDSLPTLVRIISERMGSEILSSGVILRDTTGRLAFFIDKPIDEATIEKLSASLRIALGGYARTDRIVASKDDFGVADILGDSSAQIVRVGDHTLRLLDRRLVGIDWLRAPSPAAPPPPRFVFSSLKGGVGRSTALAVAAAHLAARGQRVLAVDLDMEAPGLGALLLDEITVPEFGLIDALVENGLSPLDDTFLADLVGPSELTGRYGRIDVIPAFGRRSLNNPGDILAKIARAYTERILEDGTTLTLLDQVRGLIDIFSESKRYDVVLIDSRAGLHETTAAAVLGLGAEVFLFGLDEAQTFQGYSALFAHFARFLPAEGTIPEWVDRITMVQGRAPQDPDHRTVFGEKCQALFNLIRPSQGSSQTSVPLPAEPFRDVPWDEDVKDEELTLDDTLNARETIAILEDDRFRLFQPSTRRELLSEPVYQSSFGVFLNRVSEAFEAITESSP